VPCPRAPSTSTAGSCSVAVLLRAPRVGPSRGVAGTLRPARRGR
jgi:hypothetical protein